MDQETHGERGRWSKEVDVSTRDAKDENTPNKLVFSCFINESFSDECNKIRPNERTERKIQEKQ